MDLDDFDGFLAAKRSSETRQAYRSDLRLFASWAGVRPHRLRSVLTVQVVADWRDHLLDLGRSPHTVRRRLAAIRTFSRFLSSELGDVVRAVEKPAQPSSKALAPWIEGSDVPDVLGEARTERDCILLDLAFRVGLRRAEILALRRSSLQPDPRTGGRKLVILGKREKIRHVGLEDDLADRLAAYLAGPAFEGLSGPEAWMFPSPRDPRRHLSGRHFHRIFRAIADRSGVPVLGGRHLAPHGARRTYATAALDAGATVEELRRAMGHASIDTTSRYDLRSDVRLQVNYDKQKGEGR